MHILMKRWFSVLWFYLELIPGFAFIGAGFIELFIAGILCRNRRNFRRSELVDF